MAGPVFFQVEGECMARTTISKKVRFEIFKRDSFSCRYCGNGTSVGSILNIDHVIPVSKGGTNDVENLVTACFECNSGKSNRSLKSLNISFKNFDFSDYKDQVKEFFEYINNKKDTLDKSIDLILENIGDPNQDFDNNQRQSIKIFLNKIPLSELINYSIASNVKMGSRSPYTKFKYLCGICHNVIKSEVKNGSN